MHVESRPHQNAHAKKTFNCSENEMKHQTWTCVHTKSNVVQSKGLLPE